MKAFLTSYRALSSTQLRMLTPHNRMFAKKVFDDSFSSKIQATAEAAAAAE